MGTNNKHNLTVKQELFCQEYLKDLNGTQSAKRAGYSARSADAEAGYLLSNAKIQKRLSELTAARRKRTQITQDDVVNELRRCGFANIKKYAKWDDDGMTLEPSEELDDEDSAAVASVTSRKNQLGESTVSFKMHDKVKSLELLARHLGMLNDKLIHGGEVKVEHTTYDYSKIDPKKLREMHDTLKKAKVNGNPDPKTT